MANNLDYYRNYYKKGGAYQLRDYEGSSRVLMISRWLQDTVKPGGKVLDIGCGDGSYSKFLPEYEWTGLDINEEKTAYKGQRVVHDLESGPYPLEAGTFDAVVCSEVLEHLFDPETVHTEALRLLKPQGAYIISTPNFDWVENHFSGFRQFIYDAEETHTKEHIRFYSLDSHAKLLQKYGFRIQDYMGADLQFGSFFNCAREYLGSILMPNASRGEVEFQLGRMFPTVCHTIGVLSVKQS